MTKKYTLTQDYSTDPEAKAGTVVYRATKSDYGLARDDTAATGIPHVSVTLNPDGDYPFFTVPSTILQEEGLQDGVDAFGGRRYAGVIVNARPFAEVWPRRICGFLAGKDHKGRGFDNGPVRTSLVERLMIDDGKLYAITMNSAYQLDSVDLMAFLRCPEWVDDIDNLITQAVSKVKTLAAVDPERLESIQSFVEYAVTENRLQQGLDEIGKDIKKVGEFIGWVSRDIIKEEGDVLAHNNLIMKDVGKYLSNKARAWYMTKLNEGL